MEFNIADLYELAADTVPDKMALVDNTRRLTFREYDRRANQLAHHLASKGIGKDDHVGLFVYNGTEYMETMLAAAKIRGVSINVNYRYVADELKYVLNDADVKVLIYTRDLADVVREVYEDIDTLTHLIYIDDDSDKDVDFGDHIEFEAALAAQNPERSFGPRSGDDKFIVYTGGTTGMPKGVVWRHEDLFFAGLQGGRPQDDPIETPEELAEVVASGDFEMNIHCAPPFIHGSSQFASLIALFTGGKVVIANGRSFDAAKSAQMIDDEDVVVLVLVGDAMSRPFLDEVRANGDKYDLSTLAVLTSQGAVLSRSVQQEFAEFMPNLMVMNNYGASETGHQGRAMPDMSDGEKDSRIQFWMNEDTFVVDENFEPIEPGSEKAGRVARTGHLPLGYYNDEKKTRETFIEKNGKRWVVLGDFATVDESGLVTLLGRHSVCINTGGEKVYPEEVEEALMAHESVQDVLVVGVSDERWGQRVEAVLSVRGQRTPTAEELDAHCRGKIAGYKIPRAWHIVDKVQRQPSGKPDYKWAKKQAEAAS